MSSSEHLEELQSIPEVQETPIARKVFLNYVNSYHGCVISKALKSTRFGRKFDSDEESQEDFGKKWEIFGTLESNSNVESKDFYLDTKLDPIYCNFYERIINCDFIVFDLNFDREQVKQAFKTLELLETSEFKGVKYFLLISSPMTWGATENLDKSYTEADYRKRRPHPCYKRHIRLEQDLLNLQKRLEGRLRTLILCPGVTYGRGERTFHYFLKSSLFNKEEIDIFEPGTNEIPLLYIEDLGRIIRDVLENFPKPEVRYLLAVQPNSDFRSFFTSVANVISGLETRLKICPKEDLFLIEESLMTQKDFEKLTLNVKWIPNYFEEFEFLSDTDGFIEQIVHEYYKFRKIQPRKVLVHGPPNCGKTSLAKTISKFYSLHYIDPDSILEDKKVELTLRIQRADRYLETQSVLEAAMDPFFKQSIEDCQKNLDEWRIQLNDLEKSSDDNESWDLKEKLLLERLSSNACSKNQGYVIDGLSWDIDRVKRIFLETSEDEEFDEDSERFGTKLNNEIKPDLFIYFKYEKSFLENEEECTCREFYKKLHTSDIAEDEPCDDLILPTPMTDFDPDNFNIATQILTENIHKSVQDGELSRFRAYQETQFEDRSIFQFFWDHDLIPHEFEVNPRWNIEETIKAIWCRVSRCLGPRPEYQISKERRCEEERLQDEFRQKKIEEKEAIARKELEKKRLQREKEIEDDFKKITEQKRKEMRDIEIRSLPMRHYLVKYILPKITEGLVEVAKVRPADPVDFLAEYLFRTNPQGHLYDPCLTERAIEDILKHRLADVRRELEKDQNEEECIEFVQNLRRSQ